MKNVKGWLDQFRRKFKSAGEQFPEERYVINPRHVAKTEAELDALTDRLNNAEVLKMEERARKRGDFVTKIYPKDKKW